jgi:type I restriction enzyme S subunit
MKPWLTKPLGEFVEERTERLGQDFATIYSVTNERGFVRSLDLFDKQVFSADTGNYKRVGFHDLAYNPSRINVGSVAMCEDKDGGAVSPMYVIVRSKSGLLPHYLLRFLKSEAGLHQIRHRCEGAVRFQLKFRDLCAIPILAPPLTQQERIVKLLDEADELRKVRARADSRTTALIPSLFHEMFGDPVRNSNGWPCVHLVELCCSADDIKCGPFGTQLSKSEYIEKGVPLWGIKNVNALFELPTQEFLTPSTAQRLIQYSIEPCDIVMTRKGTVGNCAVYPERFPLGIMHSDLLRLRVSREKCEPVFLAHQLHYSRDVERQLAQISGGAVMPGINVTKLKSLKVLAPPLPLQKEFAARVSEIRAMQTEQTTSRRRLEHLFQSLLHRAFKGDL